MSAKPPQPMLWIVVSEPVVDRASYLPYLQEHLAYQADLESRGVLVFAGPLRDSEGNRSGRGLICLRAADHAEALSIAQADPMHLRGLRRFTLEGWLPSEGTAASLLMPLTDPLSLTADEKVER